MLIAGTLVPAFQRAQAQVVPAASADTAETTVIYEQEFFSSYNVRTAKDMLERVPGMASIIGGRVAGGDRRGMRSDTDQVLINGKRSTGKETDVADYLDRIPWNQVLRIEVISGNVKEIDASTGGRVVNVVLRAEEKGKGSGAYSVGTVFYLFGEDYPSGIASYNYQRGSLGITIGLETLARPTLQNVYDDIRNPAGTQIARLYEVRDRDHQVYNARTRITYAFPSGTSLQVSGYGLTSPYGDVDTSEYFQITPAGEQRLTALRDLLDGHEYKAEISTDLTVPLSANSKFLAFGIYTNARVKTDSDVFSFAAGPSPATDRPISADTRDEHTTQKIVRGTYQTNLTDKHQLEFGIEGAITQLDKDLDFFSIVNGARVNRPVFNSDNVITEDRAEVFATYTWKPVPAVEVEPGLAAEFSRLKQEGPDIRNVDARRSLKYVKPSVNAWYQVTPATRLFGSVVRDVGQLKFEDFAATYLRDDDEVVAGNPNLVPEKAWVFEIGTEHRLPENRGLIELRAFYKRVSDVNDEIQLGPAISGPGNIGRGTVYGAELQWSFKLAAMNLWDAVLSGSVLGQDSSVHDAFTGRARRFGLQRKYEMKVSYQQDFKSWGGLAGFEYLKGGPTVESDFTRFDRNSTSGDLRTYVEKELWGGIALRLSFGNALSSKVRRFRTQYVGSQASQRVLQTESRVAKNQPWWSFRIRGNF